MRNITLICCTIVLAGLACSSEQSTGIKPNILLILADDLGWSDIGCYGSEVATPNLDKLAAEGIRFTNFHNTSKCFPSRAALITGVYAQDCGYNESFRDPLRNAATIGEVLQPAGYLTYWSGKHHGIENPFHRGFTRFYGLKDGACNHFNPGLQRENEAEPAQKKMRQWCIDSVEYFPYTPEQSDFYTTDYFTNYAIEFVAEADRKNKPFFLYLAYTAPHDPLMAWPDDISKYRGKYDEGYEVIRERRYQKQLASGLIDSTYKLSDPTYRSWDALDPDEQKLETEKMEVYAAMIDRMDQNIGRLLEELKKSGQLDNTVIFFLSDNGASAEMVVLDDDNDSGIPGAMDRWLSLGADWANVGNTPYRFYKNYSYEGGINTPLVVWWPGKINQGLITRFIGHVIDLMPTIVEISGAIYPEAIHGEPVTPMRGTSLLPVFSDCSIKRDNILFWEWSDGQAAYLNDWKIVKQGRDNDWDLYNTYNDPTETRNLAAINSDKVAEMAGYFKNWRALCMN